MDAQQFCDELVTALGTLLAWLDRPDRMLRLEEWQHDAKAALSVVERIARPEVLVYPNYSDGIRDWSAVLERVRNAAQAAQPDRIEPLLATQSILASYTSVALIELVNLFHQCAAFMRVPDADASAPSSKSSTAPPPFAHVPGQSSEGEGGVDSTDDLPPISREILRLLECEGVFGERRAWTLQRIADTLAISRRTASTYVRPLAQQGLVAAKDGVGCWLTTKAQ